MKKIASVLLTIFIYTTVNAQTMPTASKPFVLGETEIIKSKVLNEQRTLNVYLPDGYNKDKTISYPVIYLLDGSADEDFVHIVGIVQFLTMIEAMPKTIIIGIANVDRERDFTFPTSIDSDRIAYPTTGHSEKFISFLEHELQPYVNAHYRTNGHKTIIGQSLGGLVTTQILIEKPWLFDDYMIVSPSLWWDHESMLQKAAQAIPGIQNNIRIYLSLGNEGDIMVGDANKLLNFMKANSKLKILYKYLPEENHLTILHHSIYDGLEMLNKK